MKENKLLHKLKQVKLETYFIILLVIYASGTILMNIWAGKTFGVGNIIPSEWNWTTKTMFPITTGGTIISWLVFACMDLITEIWGKKTSIKVFVSLGICNVIFSLIGWLVAFIPPDQTIFDGNIDLVGAINLVIGYGGGLTVRMAVGSIIAFLLGSYINTKIMDIMKSKAKNQTSKVSFTIRCIVSTIIGQLIDNGIFMLITFAPINLTLGEKPFGELFTCIGMTTLLECGIEALFDIVFVSHFAIFLKQIQNKDEIEKINLRYNKF